MFDLHERMLRAVEAERRLTHGIEYITQRLEQHRALEPILRRMGEQERIIDRAGENLRLSLRRIDEV